MKRKMDNVQNNGSSSSGDSSSDFNFDQWVKQVRPQLIASLQKRGMRH